MALKPSVSVISVKCLCVCFANAGLQKPGNVSQPTIYPSIHPDNHKNKTNLTEWFYSHSSTWRHFSRLNRKKNILENPTIIGRFRVKIIWNGLSMCVCICVSSTFSIHSLTLDRWYRHKHTHTQNLYKYYRIRIVKKNRKKIMTES